MLVFSAITLLVTYGIERLQHILPLNPQNFGPVPADLAFNTAASFTTNTNWQAYSGESTMSYLTQMAGLAWHNFISAAVGIGYRARLGARYHLPLATWRGQDAGQFLGRSCARYGVRLDSYLDPVRLAAGLSGSDSKFFVLCRNNDAGRRQANARDGSGGSQEIIKELGTNGGGFFNANSAHPFESPNPLTNFIEMLLIFAIPAAMTYTYGRMARDQKQGWVLFAAMAVIFFIGVSVAYYCEAQGNPLMRGMAVDQAPGNMEGKEARFGIANSALFATVTTAPPAARSIRCTIVLPPLGGLVPLANIQLGELVFGGVGAGLYAMLIFVLLAFLSPV